MLSKFYNKRTKVQQNFRHLFSISQKELTRLEPKVYNSRVPRFKQQTHGDNFEAKLDSPTNPEPHTRDVFTNHLLRPACTVKTVALFPPENVCVTLNPLSDQKYAQTSFLCDTFQIRVGSTPMTGPHQLHCSWSTSSNHEKSNGRKEQTILNVSTPPREKSLAKKD